MAKTSYHGYVPVIWRSSGDDVDGSLGFKPLFAFGYWLIYTTFQTSAPKLSGTTATFTVRNTGKRAGADVAQLYLISQLDSQSSGLSVSSASSCELVR